MRTLGNQVTDFFLTPVFCASRVGRGRSLLRAVEAPNSA